MLINGSYTHTPMDYYLETHHFVASDQFGYLFKCDKCGTIIWYSAETRSIKLTDDDAYGLTCHELILKRVL
jgi:predicted RNA-binding Zn-ribbon protein involved in translation (DUF1610 family)